MSGISITQRRYITTTPAVPFGKLEWRVVVIPSPTYANTFEAIFQYRSQGGGIWTDNGKWPSANQEIQLPRPPKSIVDTMLSRFKQVVEYAMEHGTPQSNELQSISDGRGQLNLL